MKKLSILALHLSYGGVEKAISDLANALSDSFEVEIISTYKILEKPAYDLDKNVKVKYLITNLKPNREEFKNYLKKFKLIKATKECFKALKILYLKKRLMKNAIKESDADIIISSRIYLNKLLSRYGKKNVLKIGWEHNHHHGNTSYYTQLVKSCKHLDKVIFVSRALCDDYKKSLKEKCVYIPNMVSFKNNAISKLDNNEITTVCRLSEEKGLFDLIDIFKYITEQNDKLKLNIVGDGVLKNALVEYTYELGIEKKVIFHGFRDSNYISKVLEKSDLYLMTSYTESFGIALLEAFCHGVPAIAFDSAEGARELIFNGKNGYLIKNRNIKEYEKKVIELINDKEKLDNFSRESVKISQNYTPDNVKEMWKKVLH